jgi:hypothetical protein
VKTADIHRDERVPLILAAAAVLLGASAFAKVAGFYVERGRMQGLAGLAQARHDPNGVKDCLSQAKKTADTIKQNNLFVKEPPKEHPIKQVDGILGNEAFIGDKWYKAGDKVGDARIVEITSTYVRVEWDGKEQNFAPIGATVSEPPSPPPVAKEVKNEVKPEEPKPAGTAEAAKVEAPQPVEEDDPLGWLGVKLSPRLRAALLTKWNSASDEEKAKAKEEWDKMSDGDKQQAVDQMEQHVDDIR